MLLSVLDLVAAVAAPAGVTDGASYRYVALYDCME